MTATMATANPPSSTWNMPTVHLGDTVIWYFDGDIHNPHVAIVTELYQNSVCVNILFPNLRNFDIRTGVRHVDDPNQRPSEAMENGLWGHTERTKRLVAIEKAIEGLGPI